MIKTWTERAARVRIYILTSQPRFQGSLLPRENLGTRLADVRSHHRGFSAIQPLAESEESWHRLFLFIYSFIFYTSRIASLF